MAAETLTADQAASTFGVPAGGPKGALLIQYGTYEVAANVEDGDIFEMHYVPPGAVVHSGELRADDLDTGTEVLDGDVGWAANESDSADPDGLLNGGVWLGDAVTGVRAEAGVWLPYNGTLMTAGPKAFALAGGKTMIQVEFNVAANSFSAGTLTAWTYYTVG